MASQGGTPTDGAGRPVARIVPYRARTTARTQGLMAGQIWLGPVFDEVDEEIREPFER